MVDFNKYIKENFGVDLERFINLLELSPNAKGYIIGAAAEEILMEKLENNDFKVLRIKEKPAGGFKAKIDEIRGDFYVKDNKIKEEIWYVVECKGLKSNSEFRGQRFLDKQKLYRFLRSLAFPPPNYKKKFTKS